MELSQFSVNENGILVLRRNVNTPNFKYTCDYEVTKVGDLGFFIVPITKNKKFRP